MSIIANFFFIWKEKWEKLPLRFIDQNKSVVLCIFSLGEEKFSLKNTEKHSHVISFSINYSQSRLCYAYDAYCIENLSSVHFGRLFDVMTFTHINVLFFLLLLPLFFFGGWGWRILINPSLLFTIHIHCVHILSSCFSSLHCCCLSVENFPFISLFITLTYVDLISISKNYWNWVWKNIFCALSFFCWKWTLLN